MRRIQNKILPNNWVKQVEKFDIDNSDLNDKYKIIADSLIKNIIVEKEKSLVDSLSKYLVFHILNGDEFLTSKYDLLPISLIKDCFDEINGEKGLNLSRKLHSIFIEFLTYLDLYDKGYEIVEFEREQGSCDLKLQKDGHIYNFEVKFKESKDIGISRLYEYLEGYSLLNKNSFLRDKLLNIILKVDYITDSNISNILNELDKFIEKKTDTFDGNFIYISNPLEKSSRSKDINQVYMEIESTRIKKETNVDDLINQLFMGKGRHIDKLIKKSKKPQYRDNFTGYLVWSIPFHTEIDNSDIENAFNNLNLDFDLYVSVSGINHEKFNFIVEKKE